MTWFINICIGVAFLVIVIGGTFLVFMAYVLCRLLVMAAIESWQAWRVNGAVDAEWLAPQPPKTLEQIRADALRGLELAMKPVSYPGAEQIQQLAEAQRQLIKERATPHGIGKAWWRLRLVFWLMFYGFVRWTQPVYAWRWTGDECWLSYCEDGFSPSAAIREDLGYA